MRAPERPALSVIVAIVSDTLNGRAEAGSLAACLDALSRQLDAPTMEVLVPHLPGVDGIEALQRQFPQTRFLPVTDLATSTLTGGSREHHDVLRARGLAAATGDLVGLLEDHARPDERWAAHLVAAHRQPWAAIGGAIENGIDRPLNWAVYFCDFGRYENPLPRGESAIASDANVTFKRSALESIRSVWESSFREVVVNGALRQRGEKVALDPDVIVYQYRRSLRLGAALKERFVWGRSYAATRCALLTSSRRIVLALLSPVLPVVLLARMTSTARSRRRHFGKLLRCLPLAALLTISWSVGEGVGYLTGRSESSSARP